MGLLAFLQGMFEVLISPHFLFISPFPLALTVGLRRLLKMEDFSRERGFFLFFFYTSMPLVPFWFFLTPARSLGLINSPVYSTFFCLILFLVQLSLPLRYFSSPGKPIGRGEKGILLGGLIFLPVLIFSVLKMNF